MLNRREGKQMFSSYSFLLVFSLLFGFLANSGLSQLRAETWRQRGFKDFARGSFQDGGANIYVSAAGRLQLINRYDLNQDGHLDLFIGTGHGHNEDEDVYAYLNNGVEIDPRRRILIPAGGAIDGLVTDLNKDGRGDLVIVNTAGGVTNLTSTYVYLHDGSSTGFTAQRRIQLTAWNGKAAAAADWNGDGWTDLAIACANYGESTPQNKTSVIYWNGPDGFDLSNRRDLTGEGVAVLAADLNGDGRVDLALAHPDQTKIYWARDSGLDWASPATLSFAGHHLAAGDMDGDGYSELAIVNREGVEILAGSAQGPGRQGSKNLAIANAAQAVISDLNRDDLPELAVTSRHQMGNEYTDSFVYWNTNGEISTEKATPLPTVNAYGISAGDLNGDGWVDLVISNSRSINDLSIQSFIYWNHQGQFHFARKSMLDTLGAQGNSIGDLNGDGRQDVVFFNYEGGQRAGYNPNVIYWGDGTRSFSPERSSSLWSGYNVGTIQADLDDDGWVDLGSVEARYSTGRPDTLHAVYLWFGGSNGYGEDRRVVLSVQDPEYGGHVADLDRDGYLDLIIGAGEEGSAGRLGYVILYGGGNGFSPNRREVIPLGQAGGPPLIADLNRDGYLDLVGGRSNNGFHLIYGSTEGFEVDKMRVLLRDRKVTQAEAADFDQDGWLDLVVPTSTARNKEGDMLVFYGSNDGLNESSVRLPHMDGRDPSLADFNRDGYVDIFISNYAANLTRNVPGYLYWGSKEGFDPRNRLALPGDSGAASITADFDSDGWIDIFLVNHKREGSRDRPGNPIAHNTDSFLYWNSPTGFDSSRKTRIPTSGPHAQITHDVGNIYTRELAEFYISERRRPGGDSDRASRIGWVAETPLGTSVAFQVRSAATSAGLDGAEWEGPAGPNSWFEIPGPIVNSGSGFWFQYRARLSTPNGGASPVLTEVAIEFR